MTHFKWKMKSLVCVAVVSLLQLAAPPSTTALTFHKVISPGGKTSLEVRNENDGSLTFSVQHDGESIIQNGTMGLVTEAYDLSSRLWFDSEEQRTVEQSYVLSQQFNGPVHSSAQEMTLKYHRGQATLAIDIRAHDEGIAFRYRVSGLGKTRVVREHTRFTFPEETGLWASPYRQAKDYEERYPYVSAERIEGQHYSLPVLASIRNNRIWSLVTEAGTYVHPTYPASHLRGVSTSKRSFEFRLPGPDESPTTDQDEKTTFLTEESLQTPWRVLLTSKSLDRLTNTSMLTDLNPAVTTAEDLSWIRSGKTLWSWWSNEEKAREGDDMLLSQREYIDAAERLGMTFVTLDCCYNDSDSSIEKLAEYAHDRGIELFIWKHKGDFTHSDGTYFNDAEVNQLLANIRARGVDGLKIDFMQSDRLETLKLYERIARSGLKNHLLVNFHGSTKPGGENRTYPNIITSEAVLGSEQYKYGRPPTAQHDATLPFTRNVVGGMDATPVIFSNSNLKTTIAHQLALGIVFSSAMLHLADSSAAYERWDGTPLLRALPTVWDESRLLDGFPDDFAVIARRSGEEWYLGAITDDSRDLDVPLSFLAQDRTYIATVFEDREDGKGLRTYSRRVQANDKMTLRLQTHGGASVHLSEAGLAFPATADRYLEAEQAEISGTARSVACSGCSKGKKVGNLGIDGKIQWNMVEVPETGSYRLRIGYLSEDPRKLRLTVDGREYLLAPPRSGRGNDGQPSGWEIVRNTEIDVPLTKGRHSIAIDGVDPWAPDIDRVALLRVWQGKEKRKEIHAATGGSTSLTINYRASRDTQMKLSVNGVISSISLPATSEGGGAKTVYPVLRRGNNVVSWSIADHESVDDVRLFFGQ